MADTGSAFPKQSSRSEKKWGTGVGSVQHKQKIGKFASNSDPVDLYLNDNYSHRKEVNYQSLV